MLCKSLMAAAVSAAIVLASPALAQGKGGGGGGAGGPPGGAPPAGANSQGSINASPNSLGHTTDSLQSIGATTKTQATTTTPTTTTDTDVDTDTNVSIKSKALQNSQGPANASPNGIAHASPNSALARGAVQSSTLPGLTTGLVVNNTSGTQVGTVTKIITGPNNTIRAVVVKTSSGQLVTLPPSSLTISGSVVTTTSTSIGG